MIPLNRATSGYLFFTDNKMCGIRIFFPEKNSVTPASMEYKRKDVDKDENNSADAKTVAITSLCVRSQRFIKFNLGVVVRLFSLLLLF